MTECALRQFQPVQREQQVLQPGDCVRYIGPDSKIQQDYGGQDLLIVAIDFRGSIAICDNGAGLRLVGVALQELHYQLRGLSGLAAAAS